MAKYEFSHQVVVYSSDNQLEWREMEGRQLPALQLFATGIYQPPFRAVDAIAGRGRTASFRKRRRGGHTTITEILSWGLVSQSWQPVGDVALARLADKTQPSAKTSILL